MNRGTSMNKQLTAGICVMLVLTAACFAGVVIAPISGFTVNSVDASGNPDHSFQPVVPAKAFKFLSSGIIVNVARGQVRNLYGNVVLFTDQGVQVTDPETNTIAGTATSDAELVLRPRGTSNMACMVEIAVYDPNLGS